MMSPEEFQKLRAPFDPAQIGKLPKPTAKDNPKGRCQECGGWHGLPAVHLDYVGHAAITDRLLHVDPHWTWEPMAVDPSGFPLLDQRGGLWIKLTVCGVTRPGYGDETNGKGMKEIIGDALRNAAMRFGVGLDLWSKEDLNGDSTTGAGASTPTPSRDVAPPPAAAPAPAPQFKAPDGAVKTPEPKVARAPDDGGDPGSVLLTFGKHKGKRIREAPNAYLEWWVGQPEPNTAELRRQREAALIFLGRSPRQPVGADADIPFR